MKRREKIEVQQLILYSYPERDREGQCPSGVQLPFVLAFMASF